MRVNFSCYLRFSGETGESMDPKSEDARVKRKVARSRKQKCNDGSVNGTLESGS